ncbi:hypothetical protein BaRGS_00004174 [Batillaria attramentaria]|uniref:Uncharacterized protein n=1 Tax=Batillaria attramentaria TaxID=370345 RepID=A0ABD0M003_9CAEN
MSKWQSDHGWRRWLELSVRPAVPLERKMTGSKVRGSRLREGGKTLTTDGESYTNCHRSRLINSGGPRPGSLTTDINQGVGTGSLKLSAQNNTCPSYPSAPHPSHSVPRPPFSTLPSAPASRVPALSCLTDSPVTCIFFH